MLLRDDADANALTAKLPAMVERYMGSEIARTNAYHLQPFREAYLYSIRDYGFSLFGGNIAQLYQFGAVSLFVLAIAGVNFTNLTTALSARRAREVGLRKVTGASRTQLIAQFVGESVMTALAALALALVLVRLALPEFNGLFGKQLELSVLAEPIHAALLGVGAVAVGIAAGAYPALFLASFQPSETLKGTLRGGTRGQWLRTTLVVGQFTISIVLIVGSGVIYQQLQYLRDKDLGYDAEQVVFLPISGPIVWARRGENMGDWPSATKWSRKPSCAIRTCFRRPHIATHTVGGRASEGLSSPKVTTLWPGRCRCRKLTKTFWRSFESRWWREEVSIR